MSIKPTEGRADSLSRRQTVRLVSKCIAEQTPIAIVRFGEGEGRLLAADPNDEVSVRLAVRKLMRQTGLTFSASEMFKVKNLVMNALDKADVVGLQVSESFADEHREWGERIASVYAERVAQGGKTAHVAHCLINNDLRDELPRLLAGQRQLTVISCRDIAPILKTEHGLDDVAVYQTPSQYVVRDVDGSYEKALHDVPIWPDFYRELRTRITVRKRGEVFLVGVGVFGKELCIHIRDNGGIALDMGSTLDGIACKVTRDRGRPTFRSPPETPKLV
jgi:GT-D fold-like domain